MRRWFLCILGILLSGIALFAKTGLGVDVDFYTGPIPKTVWKHLLSANQKFVIAQTWGGRSRNEFAASQLAGARAIGMKTAAYVLLNYDDKVCPTFEHPVRDSLGRCTGDLISQEQPGGRWQVRQGLAALGSELNKVSFIAIDIEWFAPEGPSSEASEQARRRTYILDAIDEVWKQNKKPVIYTRNARGHWSDITGCDVISTSDGCMALHKVINNPVTPIALWDVEKGDPELQNFRPHGDWTKRLGRQYKLDTSLFGLSPGKTVDLNIFDLSLFAQETKKPVKPAVRKVRSLSRKNGSAANGQVRRGGQACPGKLLSLFWVLLS
jgi:hypothetical protein